MEVLGYFAFVIMGIVLGTMGGGGSILTVPILVYLFAINPVQATSYSLFIVGTTALVGGFFYLKRKEVDLQTGFTFAIPSFLGVFFSRAYLVPQLPNPVFTAGSLVVSKPLLIMLIFSILMVLASISMITSKKNNIEKDHLNLTLTSKFIILPAKGIIVGIITGFVGAGGGFLIIPTLVLFIGLSMKKAVGTSLYIIAANALFGFFAVIGRETAIDWKFLGTVVVLAVAGLFLGITVSKKFNEKSLKKSFGYFVLLMGITVLFDQIHKL